MLLHEKGQIDLLLRDQLAFKHASVSVYQQGRWNIFILETSTVDRTGGIRTDSVFHSLKFGMVLSHNKGAQGPII